METKHTKGEWTVIKNGLNSKFSPPRKLFLINSINKTSVNQVSNIAKITMQIDINDLESEANAKLIASAPDLLENLIRCVDRLEENRLGHFTAVRRAKEAIKKATE